MRAGARPDLARLPGKKGVIYYKPAVTDLVIEYTTDWMDRLVQMFIGNGIDSSYFVCLIDNHNEVYTVAWANGYPHVTPAPDTATLLGPTILSAVLAL